jgi:hypothetical protein
VGLLNKSARNKRLATQLAPRVGRPEVAKGTYGLELKHHWYVSIVEVTLISTIGVIYVQFL